MPSKTPRPGRTGRRLKPTWTKFVQIAASAVGGRLYALADDGRVWIFNERLAMWARLPAKRHAEFAHDIEEVNHR